MQKCGAEPFAELCKMELGRSATHLPSPRLQQLCASAENRTNMFHTPPCNCTACAEWWQPANLYGASEEAAARHLLHRVQQGHHRPSLAWFICATKPEVNGSQAWRMEYLQHIRVAVASALLHAPTLAPHVIYMHTERQPYVEDDFTSFVRAVGGRLIMHRLSFANEVQGVRVAGQPGHLNLGAYCRLDVPQISRDLASELEGRGIETERVLYTDADVLFAGDFRLANETAGEPLPTFYAGTEVFDPKTMNSGVMLINTTAFLEERPAMMAYAARQRWRFVLYDQTWIAKYFYAIGWPQNITQPYGGWGATTGDVAKLGTWRRLDDSLYNGRAFAHPRRPPADQPDAEVRPPRIWHWHGYKPTDVRCWLQKMVEEGRWPQGGRHPIPSGCKSFETIDARMGACYLRSYVWLLDQHDAMLRVTDLAHELSAKGEGRAGMPAERQLRARLRISHKSSSHFSS